MLVFFFPLKHFSVLKMTEVRKKALYAFIELELEVTENHFGPGAVNVITKTCSGEIRKVSEAQETKKLPKQEVMSSLGWAVLVSQTLALLREAKAFQALRDVGFEALRGWRAEAEPRGKKVS